MINLQKNVTNGWWERTFLLGAMTQYLLIHSSWCLRKTSMKLPDSCEAVF